MASSKLMSRNSDLKRKLSTRASSSSSSAPGSDFLRTVSGSVRDNFVSDSTEGFFRNGYLERNSSPDHSDSGANLNAEVTLFDAMEAIEKAETGGPGPRKTVDDVWREIVEGKKKEQQRKQPKQEMMTLEDFLLKVEQGPEMVEVKEEGFSGGSFGYENISSNYSGGLIGMEVGMDVGGVGAGRGQRSLSLLEPLDKAAQQRQKRMIKNRESAARSRERKQAYQVELESMAVRLEEENERLLKEKEEQMKKRHKQLLENVIPVVEKRRPRPLLRKVYSM